MAKAHNILILGGGFGGVYAAMALEKLARKRRDLHVTLVSEDNFMLFTPLLHEVAAGDLYPGDVVNPIRALLKNVRFVQAAVDRVDLDAKKVHAVRGLRRKTIEFAYDHLILGVGSESNFFGIDGVADNAVTMKTLGDAALLHNRMLAMFEQATAEPSRDERQKMLTFVAAGGGFAGVETIGAVNDFLRDAAKLYPDVGHQDVRVVLVHPHDVVLPELGEKLGKYAQKKLQQRGVEVILNAQVEGYADNVVKLSDGQSIPTYNLIWTAGVKPGRVVEQLPVEQVKGRIKVENTLRVPGHDALWAVGDCASVPDYKTGKPQPPTAQHGLRQAVHAAKNLVRSIDGKSLRPFKFGTIGQLASIGHHVGVATIMGVNFSGFPAWWLWRTVYLAKLPRLAKKSRVAASWTLDMLFQRDYEQLVTARDIQTLTNLKNRFAPISPDEGKPV